MKTIVFCIAGFIGLAIIFFLYCCLVVGARADRHIDELCLHQRTEEDKPGPPKQE